MNSKKSLRFIRTPLNMAIATCFIGMSSMSFANNFYKAHDMDDNYQLWLNGSEFLYDVEATNDDDIILTNNNIIEGKAGNDTLKGGASENIFDGGPGNDMFFGGGSRDVLGTCNESSDAGHDRLYGQEGNDYFCDNFGHNIFYGGPGNDQVYLSSSLDNATDDTYVWTQGNDRIALGEGFDTLILKNIKASEAQEWMIHLTTPFEFSVPFISNSGFMYYNTSEKSGYITGPNGERIDFTGINKFDFEYIYPLQFNNFSNDQYIVGTVISGLPEGFAISGMAQPPQLHEDGYWFQAVDQNALAAGQLELIPTKGYVGEINLEVLQIRDRALAITELNRGSIPVEIHPTHDNMLFAKFGAVTAEDNGELGGFGNMRRLPLNIVVNGLTASEYITIEMTEDYELYTNNELLTPFFNLNGLDFYSLNKNQLTNLYIYDQIEIEELEVFVTLNATIEGYTGVTGINTIGATKALYKPDFKKGLSPSPFFDERELVIDASIHDYDISRIGNNFMVKHITREREEFLVDMVNMPNLEFNDGYVRARDFYTNIDVGGIVRNASVPSRTLITFANLPVGAVINNAIQLGDGVYGLFADEVRFSVASIDYPSIGDRVEAEIAIGAATLTSEQVNLFGNATRVQGFVNAQAYAAAGANANLSVGPDGVSAEARAFVEAGGVATAGGQVGGLNGEVSAEVVANADVAFSVMTSDTEASIGAYAVAQASATASGNLEFNNEYVPGTESALEGTVGVNATAYVGGDSNFYFGDGRFGGSAEGGFEAGYSATADGYAFSSLAGVGAGVGGGVSAGPGVGFDAGGYAMYDNGVITFGLSGEALLLVGGEFDFDVSIDANAVADTAELVVFGIVTASDAIARGIIDAAEGVSRGYMTVNDAIALGYLSAEDAVLEGLVDARTAINNLGADIATLAEYGYSTADTIARIAINDTVRLIQDNTYNQLSNKTLRRAKRIFRKL